MYTLNDESRKYLKEKFTSISCSDELIGQSLSCFSSLQLIDVDSMCTPKETKLATNFRDFVWKKEEENIKKFKSIPHCFWSCFEARIMSQRLEIEGKGVADNSYPFISLLFSLCTALRTEAGGVFSQHLTQVSYAISRIYASFAQGVALVFLSSDKPTEPSGITLGNNFWMAELPVLQVNKERGIISEIFISVNIKPTISHLLVARESKLDFKFDFKIDFKDPFPFSFKILGPTSDTHASWETRTIQEWTILPLWRRDWHKLDDLSIKSSFVVQKMDAGEWAKWRISPPRKPITVGVILRLYKRWKNKCKKRLNKFKS